MIATVTAIGGLLGLIASLIFLAVQTRAVSEQLRMAANVSGTTGLDQCLNNLRDVYFKMMEYPGLRKYFYDEVPCPEAEIERERVLLLAEALADVLETGLMTTRRIAGTESFEDWRDYCCYILDHSPTLRGLVGEHPAWWPDLRQLMEA
ncbi:hypothetical protein AW27_016705 [Streptomyces sp. PCS3-D2]|uniref:hypothetical protein n=1 Tax=Streptomyces sp. PCS3-D2 TaxID=1460244 RepID=UPI000446AD86|nr:hypothetical protein [Streptomyces sp. PCS3-D2]WKV73034.1 hypothetical protein AW27_016705 [Streptomyces sp. PCS3-D2]